MQKPNQPIVLEETSITHIQEQSLPAPCPIRSILHLSPRLRPSIDSDEFPRCILSKNMYMPFRISLSTGGKLEVRRIGGSLIPVHSPCTVIPKTTQIRSVSFSVLNFKRFYGAEDKGINVDGMYRRLGVAKLEADRWRIDIIENCNFSSEDRKILKQESGYAVTHTGSIECKNGDAFSVQDAENLLKGLRTFLSFAAGAACGLTLVKAIDENGEERCLMWGSAHVEPWNENKHSWLPVIDGGDSLTEAFPKFWDLFTKEEWNDTIREAVDWYLNGSSGAIRVGIVAQAALESLSSRINQKKIKPVAKALRQALKRQGIGCEIPARCGALKAVAQQEKWNGRPGSNHENSQRNCPFR